MIDRTDGTDGIAGADENDVGTVIDGTIKEKNLMETIDWLNPTNGSHDIDGTGGISGINAEELMVCKMDLIYGLILMELMELINPTSSDFIPQGFTVQNCQKLGICLFCVNRLCVNCWVSMLWDVEMASGA